MNSFLLLVLLLSSCCFSAYAQSPLINAPPPMIAITAQAQAQAQAQPVPPVTNVVDDESLVPPQWLQSAVITLKSTPVVGPYVVLILQWLAVVTTILTALCAFLLLVLKSLASVLSLARLGQLALLVQSLEKSKLIYWLKYLSVFNAQKPESKDPYSIELK